MAEAVASSAGHWWTYGVTRSRSDGYPFQAKAAGCRAIGATVVLLSSRTKTTTERDVVWTRGTTRRATDDA